MQEREKELRARLGVPEDAESVLVFGETSHWDPNWLFTSEEYYRKRIRKILVAAIEALEADPGRVFSVESLFFVQMFWEREPELRERFRTLVNERRLRFTGTGITTPDTLLPETEAIVRDYLHGQEWLRAHGMDAEPRLAYLPDDFGHSPALPSLLAELGYDQAAVTRIDGMHFVAADYRPRSAFPLPGSSAHLLAEQHKSLDFVWVAPDGSEVLTHWNAFTYFQGDMLAHIGIIRWMGVVFGFPWRTGSHVARRVRSFVRQLQPLARTPYLFCPIGCDFNGPIHDLGGLLARYNERRYPDTGVYVVCAGLDDYLDLVATHRDRLPRLRLDPNPYWMGFYASRPGIKRQCNRLTRKNVLAEKLLDLPGSPASAGGIGEAQDELRRSLARAWDHTVVANHHDFITGTSPDRVWREEQQPWLEDAERLVDSVLEAFDGSPKAATPPPNDMPYWRLEEGRLEVRGDHYRAVLDESQGGCIVTLEDGAGRPLIDGAANDLVAYDDSGGLWRMGHEYRGGRFRPVARASRLPARISVTPGDGLLEVRVESELADRPVTRWLWFRRSAPVIRMRIVGAAGRRKTIVCRFPMANRPTALTMDVPGGVVVRPPEKLYRPTFWPAGSVVLAESRGDDTVAHAVRGGSLAAFLGGPACVGLSTTGAMQWVALRNVHRERAFRVLPVLAHPATGRDPDEHTFDYAIHVAPGTGVAMRAVLLATREALGAQWFLRERGHLEALAASLVTVDRDDVAILAAKRASRGEGLIVRLACVAPGGATRLRTPGSPVVRALRCDGRERDLAELAVEGEAAVVPLDRSTVTVRLLAGDAADGPSGA